MIGAFQLGAAPRAPATVEIAASSKQLFATAITDMDELDNPTIATDSTLTPARGCKGCFG